MKIEIYTDGACEPNPGPGGWGAIIIDPQRQSILELGGHELQTTSNRMELSGPLAALKEISSIQGEVLVKTDSQYVCNCISIWAKNWEKNGWLTKGKEPVKNADLIKEIRALIQNRTKTVTFQYVPGHAGVPGNERCDEIAESFVTNDSPELFVGSVDDYPIDLKAIPSAETQRKNREIAKRDARQKKFSKQKVDFNPIEFLLGD